MYVNYIFYLVPNTSAEPAEKHLFILVLKGSNLFSTLHISTFKDYKLLNFHFHVVELHYSLYL